MKNLVLPLAIATIGFSSPLWAQSTEPRVKRVPSVIYPVEASKTGIEGEVGVSVDVDASGKVIKVTEVTGPDWVCPEVDRPDVLALRRVATEAAKRSLLIPAQKDGKAVASQTWLRMKFRDPSPKKQSQGGLSGVRLDRVAAPDSLPKEPGASTATRETRIVPGAVLTGSPKSLPQPAYPPAARAVKASGTVEVQVLIDTNGTVFRSEAISGHPLLRNSARLAACKARFSPTLLLGKPVMVSGLIIYTFVP